VRAIEVVLVDPRLGLVTDFIEAVKDPGVEWSYSALVNSFSFEFQAVEF